jgi:hypothetical protein
MGNNYSGLSVFDEKIRQVNKIDKQINSFKKHLESSIKNENRVKEIRVKELNNNSKKKSNNYDIEFSKKENLVNVLLDNVHIRNMNNFKSDLKVIEKQFVVYKREKENEYNKKKALLELKKDNEISTMYKKYLESVEKIKNKYDEYDDVMKIRKEIDINKYSKINAIKTQKSIDENDEIKNHVVEDSNNKIKNITNNIRTKITFLLKKKSKLIDQLKRINPESDD